MAALATSATAGAKAAAESLVVYHDTLSPIQLRNRIIEATTSIGLRPTQEDRLTVVPSFFRDDCTFIGIFDGKKRLYCFCFVGPSCVCACLVFTLTHPLLVSQRGRQTSNHRSPLP